MRRLDPAKAKGGRAPKGRWRAVACTLMLGFGAPSTASAQIGLAGASDGDWTVLTVSPDGAWGTATEEYLNRAIANAIARCREKSNRALGCGAYMVSVQRGWALGLRCGTENILATGVSLADTVERAHQREVELRTFYHPEAERCRQLVVVGPDGAIKTPQPQSIASGSRRER